MPRCRPQPRLGLASFALLALIATSPARAADNTVPGELIVKYRSGVEGRHRASVLAALPAYPLVTRLDLIRAERIRVPAGSEAAAIATLAADPRVEYAQLNHVFLADAMPNDPLFGQLWNLHNTGQGGAYAGDDIDAVRAWDLYTGDPDLRIGVIDTGIDYTHADLAANVWTNPGEIAGNAIDDDGNGYVDDVHGYDVVNGDGDPMDDAQHGTHVAGTIGAAGNDGAGIVGVNWRCSMVAIKFMDAAGIGNEADAIAALQYAVAVGVKVTNNSWGNIGGGQALLDAINAAGAAGQLAIFAAGNNGWNIDAVPFYPPSYMAPSMINVAATDGRDLRPTWSNFGPHVVHLGAPGAAIYSCKPGGTYQSLNGTSMAAPHVTGTVALAMGRFPHADAARIRQLVLEHTDPVASMAATTITGGRLNAYLVLANGDVIPPSGVADLEVAGADTASLSLHWTAPGDDSTAGTATRYELRYASAPLDSDNFAAANLASTSAPLPPGASESCVLAGLAPGTSWWAAIRAIDDFGNPGPLSNVAAGSTLLPGTGVQADAPAGATLRLACAHPVVGPVRFALWLPAAGVVRASIHDVSGRHVATLAHGLRAAGSHVLTWDAGTPGHDPAAPGVYFLRVQTPEAELVQRFARLR